MTTEQTFASVWDALEDTPTEAENMKVRSALMMQLNQHLEQLPGTDADKATRLGITRPRYSDLKHGRIQRSCPRKWCNCRGSGSRVCGAQLITADSRAG